uniref:Acetyl-coenzyme A transporter 1 n=1 Tax=Sipha flava TaxID=143950 RepID=A0A2S2QEU1_9HEMI
MISSKQTDKPKTSESEDVVFTDTNLKGDWSNVFLLILMYTMQGLCIGVCSSIPILLKSRKDGTYSEQAIYSITSYPYFLKLFWAPLVDSYYIHKFGRRKTWLVSTQFLIGIVLLYAGRNIDTFLPEKEKPNITALVIIFFSIVFLSATQDIAVDGWALTMLKKNNVGYASTCNTTGLAFGIIIGNVLTILLTSSEFCNKYIRFAPSAEGIISLNNSLYGVGITIILLTIFIAIFKKEKDNTLDDDFMELNIIQSYSLLWNVLKIRNVKILAIALLTVKIGFAATDSLSSFKLMDAGISKDDISIIHSVVPGIHMIIPLIVAKYTSGPKVISVYLRVIPYRLLLNLAFILFVYVTKKIVKNNGVIEIPVYYYVLLAILTLLQQVLMYIMFIAILSFFSRISDPRFGGIYMTLLNTLSNLGGMLSNTAALGLFDLLTFKHCSVENSNINPTNEDCTIIVDGYYVEEVLCTIIGIIWISIFRKKFKSFQTLSPSHWSVHRKSPVIADDKEDAL